MKKEATINALVQQVELIWEEKRTIQQAFAEYKMARYLPRFLFSIFSELRRSQEHKNATKNEANI